MQLPDRDFYEAKYSETDFFGRTLPEKITDEILNRSIMTAVISILFCMVCLMGVTWAWFTSVTSSGTNTLTAASFDLEVTVTEAMSGNKLTKQPDGYYSLFTGFSYQVMLHNTGSAGTGFCLLSVKLPGEQNATAFYTESITGEEFTFTVRLDMAPGENDPYFVRFTPMWGQCPETRPDRIARNGNLFTPGVANDTVPDPPTE